MLRGKTVFFFADNNMMYMVFPTAHVVDSAKLRATVDHATNNKHIVLTSLVISSSFLTQLAYNLVGTEDE